MAFTYNYTLFFIPLRPICTIILYFSFVLLFIVSISGLLGITSVFLILFWVQGMRSHNPEDLCPANWFLGQPCHSICQDYNVLHWKNFELSLQFLGIRCIGFLSSAVSLGCGLKRGSCLDVSLFFLPLGCVFSPLA